MVSDIVSPPAFGVIDNRPVKRCTAQSPETMTSALVYSPATVYCSPIAWAHAVSWPAPPAGSRRHGDRVLARTALGARVIHRERRHFDSWSLMAAVSRKVSGAGVGGAQLLIARRQECQWLRRDTGHGAASVDPR
jgi:hypothetical protein